MKTLFIFFISFSLLNCGYECEKGYNFDTSLGICVYLNSYDITLEQVETIINYSIEEYSNRFDVSQETIKDKIKSKSIELYFVSSILKSNNALGLTEFVYKKPSIIQHTSINRIIIYILMEHKALDCIGNSSLAHEALHLIEGLDKGAIWVSKNNDNHTPDIYDAHQLCDNIDDYLKSTMCENN